MSQGGESLRGWGRALRLISSHRRPSTFQSRKSETNGSEDLKDFAWKVT